MLDNPLFSVIIPTRQRHDTLRYAIQSVINQTYKNFELIVMDNYSTSETYEVVQSFEDTRIKYYRSEERLSMADNWELGLSHAVGDYVFILGDDDALMPDGIEIGLNLIKEFNVNIISWFRCQYWWPNVIVPAQRNRLFLNLFQVAEIWQSREKLNHFYNSQCIFENLPMIYNSFVDCNLINRIKSIYGKYFMTHTPDVESGIINAYFSEKYLYSIRPLSVAGLSGHSTGTSQGYSSFNSQALDLFKKEHKGNISKEIHGKLTETLANQEIYVADAALKIKELYFADNSDIELDIEGLLKLMASRINRDVAQYETTLGEIQEIAKKNNIDISALKIPEKKNYPDEAYQGPVFNNNGSFNSLVINCEQLGVTDVAHAAMVCQGLLPHKKLLKVNTGNFGSEENSQESHRLQYTGIVVIDGVFFQLYSTGIARVWRSLLQQWTNTEFAAHIIVLDRVNTAPKIPGIRYRQVPAYSYNNTDADKQMLQQVCEEEGADLFISTYYTTPISTPSVFMAYDMIPEALETDLNKAMWREKHHAIGHASSYISISENTARDLVKFFPDIQPDEVTVAHCGVPPTFTPATTEEISAFKHKYGISKPYFILVGGGSDYKNSIWFFRAFTQLYSKQGFEIVCTGGGITLANEYRQYASGSVVHPLILSDEELKVAYSGAVALVYPSLYEGFGMPVAEALACGCPVITSASASIPEVAGEAAMYVNVNDVDCLTDALCEVQKPKVRNSLISAGLEQVKKFSWGKMADIMSAALMKATLQRLNLREINLIIFPDWSQPEETVGLELQAVIKSLVTHPDKSKMTLLIDNSNISAEDADLILSSVAMNLLMEEELEVDEGPEIVLVGELSQIQWSALMLQLQGRIKLDNENEEAITVVDENIPVYEIQGIERSRAIRLETGGWELFKLSEINFIIFPDWSQPEETVGLELQAVIKSLVTHPDKSKMTLLIDNSNISAEDADLILSSVAMNLLMEEELEVDEGPEIVLVGELSQIQWSALISQLQGRIKLENENEEVKVQVKADADSIPGITLDSLKEKFDWINLSSKQVVSKQDNFENQPINKIKSESLTEKDEAEKILSELEILEKGTTESGQPIGFFRQIGDVESYYEQTQKVVNDLHSFIFQNPDNKTAHQIAKWFTLKAKLFLYFSQANLKNIYKKRAEIIEFALKIEGYQVDYDFPERTGDRQKIRLGIIANNFEPHPETFATLPVYKHLNKEEFEIILYYLQASGHRLERYCYDHADAAIELPEDIELQVKAVRKNDLDILFISTNITSQTNAITLLASHRLARIQIVGMNSPVTTGMRHIDRYISSKLTDSETNAKEHYTEKLVTLDGPDQCFDFATEKELSVTTTISRKELNIDENTVVYISGANFYKIIPEVEATWVKIIAQVPNSMLLLYPFNPNWAPTYPIKAFKERFSATLSKYGVSEERLVLLNALPNRADIKECLKLANIYLDAYPFSGMTSLIDPLQVCLPTVVMQRESARSRRGASLLRYLEIPELIADSEDTYIQLAVNLGNNSDLRAVYRDRIERKMQKNPQFLDSRYYSTQMGYLFQKVFQEYLASDN